MDGLPDISRDFAAWYQDIVYRAELADQSPVRGALVIRPYGYALWEQIKGRLDTRIKETGHQNAMFPLLIPESFLKKEAEHVKGFAPEVAVVTHAGGSKLEEPLVIRPTSETMVHYMFSRWITSWRDLPLKINQWANIVRWEMRPRAFLRTTEILWQEGHTAHETKEEAVEEVATMLQEYVDLAQNYLAIPVITGTKSDTEKFPGAQETHTFEALMQDGKALQMGTSHLLSQSFCHSFDIKFQDRNGDLAYPYLTSWGVTTRLVGAVVMVHGDQKGLVLPPRVAPIQVVIVPIMRKDFDTQRILDIADGLEQLLKTLGIRVFIDRDDSKTPGNKFFQWEMKGVPLRLEIGPRDVEAGQLTMVDRLDSEKQAVSLDDAACAIQEKLEAIQKNLFERALKRQEAMMHRGEKLADFGKKLESDGGFYRTGWCGDAACENELKRFKAGSRCLLPEKEATTCFHCDRASVHDILVAKGY